MRVAIVSYDFGESCIQIAGALTRHAEVLLVLPKQLAAPHMSKLNPSVQFHPFDRPRLRQPICQLRTVRSIISRVHQFRPDVVHFQRGHLWFNFALPWLQRYPLVMTIHDPRHHLGDHASRKTPQFLMDRAYRRADRAIVYAEQLRHVLVEEVGIPDERIHYAARVATGERDIGKVAPEEDGLVLFFGRIWEYKGLDYLIRAEPLITAQAPHAKFVIAGHGTDFGHYKKMMVHAERFEVHNRWITDDERTEMFQRASLVTLPYVEATQSGVVPIAYTYSKPVVATRTGGLPEVVDHGRTGLLVPPRNERELAKAIVSLLNDDALRRQMGRAGKEKLDAEASPDVVAQQHVDVYRSAIDGRRKQPNMTLA